MKILFFTAPSENNYVRLGRCGGRSKAGEKWPPVKLMFCAGAVRDQGDVRIIDAEGVMAPESFSAQVQQFQPDLAVAEPTAGSGGNDNVWAGKIKLLAPEASVIAIGAFASGMPKQFLEEFESFDYVAAGEAESIIRSLASGEPQEQIANLWGRHGSEPICSEQFADFDKLPFPAHDLINQRIYSSPFTKHPPFTVTETSRGCPFSCIFCNAATMSGNKPRFRSIATVSQELAFIRGLGFREVKFNDETFNLDRSRTLELSAMIAADHAGLSWKCNVRADLLDDELLGSMSRAGCHLIYMGIESASAEILDYYRKTVPLEILGEIVRTARKHSIATVMHFMIGAPGESWETINENIRAACAADPDFVGFNILTPYPGTELMADLTARGLLTSTDWLQYDQSGLASLRTEKLSSTELVEALGKSNRAFYLRPAYLAGRLARIKSPGEFFRTIATAGRVFLRKKNSP